jgi:hypothetical protein
MDFLLPLKKARAAKVAGILNKEGFSCRQGGNSVVAH